MSLKNTRLQYDGERFGEYIGCRIIFHVRSVDHVLFYLSKKKRVFYTVKPPNDTIIYIAKRFLGAALSSNYLARYQQFLIENSFSISPNTAYQ